MKASLSKRKHRIVEDITSFLTKKRRDKYRNCFIRLLCNGLILYNSEPRKDPIVFVILFVFLFALTQIKTKDKIIAFMLNYFPFDIPIISWAIYRISLGDYGAWFVFVAYAGWIFWYINKNKKGLELFSLVTYTVWSAGLALTVLSRFPPK